MQRPKRKENEEDLLKFQDEFFKKHVEPSAKVQRVTKSTNSGAPQTEGIIGTSLSADSRTTKVQFLESPAIPAISEIKENRSIVFEKLKQNKFQGGFPAVPRLKDFKTEQAKEPGNKKQSLFARQFLSRKPSDFGFKGQTLIQSQSSSNYSKNLGTELDQNSYPIGKEKAQTNQSHLVTGRGLSTRNQAEKEQSDIHNENVTKLSQMTEQDILAEKASLEAAIDPNLLKFIKLQKSKQMNLQNAAVLNDVLSKSQVNSTPASKQAEESKGGDSGQSFDPYCEFEIDKDLPGMDVVEEEKLEWMKHAVTTVQKDDKESKSVRFDFEGNLIARNDDIPVYRGLHHHGDDDMAPGYTLDELFNLARSNYLQQKVFALKVLAKIMEKHHTGYFIDKIQGCVTERLIDAGLPFLLRWSLDDSTDAVHSSSIYAFHSMLCNQLDFNALDASLYLIDGFKVKSLQPPSAEMDIKNLKAEKGGKLSDPEMISIDLVKGMLQIQILPRIRYILEMCEPDRVTVNYCLGILSRIALHSMESSYKVSKCPRMMQTIFSKFLPITWPTEGNSLPCCKALQLIRFICLAGKSLATTLWKDHDLCTRAIRYVSLIDGDNNPNAEEENLAVESIHIWRICLHYGVGIENTIDVYPLVVSLLQKYAVMKQGVDRTISSSVVLLAESMIRATNFEHQDKGATPAKKVCFEDEKAEIFAKIEWEMVAGLHTILLQSVKDAVKLFILGGNHGTPSLRFLSTLLAYISSYIDLANAQPKVNKLDLLTQADSWMNDVILAIMGCEKFKTVTDSMSNSSDLLTPAAFLRNNETPKCLPNHGMNIFKNGSRVLVEHSVLGFMTSFAKLLHSITVVNKQCSQKLFRFLLMETLVDYCRKVSSDSTSVQKISSTASSSVVERKFLYYVLSLFEISNSFPATRSLEPDCFQVYRSTTFKLLTLFQSGEDYYANDVMTRIIFNRKMFTMDADVESLVTKLDAFRISTHSEMSEGMAVLLKKALDSLGPIYDVYRNFCAPNWKQQSSFGVHFQRESNLVVNGSGPLIPFDWVFLPIITLYNLSINVELDGKVIRKVTEDAIKSIEMNLLFIIILELNSPDFLRLIPPSVKLVRILCVFLIGNDAFLEQRVNQLLQTLLSLYSSPSTLEKLEFDIHFPGISSFYDLFCDLLIHFSASSFGDHVFSNYLLLPLQQRHNVKYRKAVWGEFSDALRCFTMPVNSVTSGLGNFFDDVEQDEELLQLYLKNLMSGAVTPTRCPLFYLVAVHHLSHKIFNQRNTKDYAEMAVSESSLRLLNLVVGMKNEGVKSDIIMYDTLDQTSSKGFRTHTSLPAYRQLIIENRFQETRPGKGCR